MYVYGANDLKGLTALSSTPWYLDSIFVFEGDFTVEDDKYALVDVVIGMWAMLMCVERKHDVLHLYELVEKDKARVFPERYFKAVGGINSFEKIFQEDEELVQTVRSCAASIRGTAAAKKTLDGPTRHTTWP